MNAIGRPTVRTRNTRRPQNLASKNTGKPMIRASFDAEAPAKKTEMAIAAIAVTISDRSPPRIATADKGKIKIAASALKGRKCQCAIQFMG